MRNGSKRLMLLRPLASRELGLKTFLRRAEVIIVDTPRNPYLAFGDVQIPVSSSRNTDEVMQRIRAYCATHSVDGILTLRDYLVPVAAQLGEEFGLRSISPVAAEICVNKALFRERLSAAGLAVPAFRVVSTSADTAKKASALELPILVKPADAAGARGITIISELSFLEDAVDAALQVSQSNLVVIEEFLEGDQISVETYTFDGVTEIIGINYYTRSAEMPLVPSATSYTSDTPALDAETYTQLKHTIETAFDLLGINWTVTHTEVLLTVDGPVLIEVNPRVAGGLIPQAIIAASGVNLYGRCARAGSQAGHGASKRSSGHLPCATASLHLLTAGRRAVCVLFVRARPAGHRRCVALGHVALGKGGYGDVLIARYLVRC